MFKSGDLTANAVMAPDRTSARLSSVNPAWALSFPLVISAEGES
jgi:hypothetical protein